MKKRLLLTLACLSLMQVSAQDLRWRFFYAETMLTIDSVRKNYEVVTCVAPYTPVAKAGLCRGDVIISETENKLTVKRAGNQTVEIEAEKVPVLSSTVIEEFDWAIRGTNCEETTYYFTEKTLGVDPIEVIADPEANLLAYETFDFDFAGSNIIEQKEIAAEIESSLTNLGLRRDKENPQLIIVIEYYSNRRDQYVPPTSRTVTRYRYGYEYGSGWGTRQYIDSQTEGNYTKTEYLTRISFAMLDAQKMQQEKADVQVWAANYEVLSSEKPNFKDITSNIASEMIFCFPIKNLARMRIVDYYGIGVAYDNNNKGVLAAVYPHGPAYAAGLRVGDKILSYKPGGNIPYDFGKISQNMGGGVHKNHENFAFTRSSNTAYPNSWTFPVEKSYLSLANEKIYEQNPHIVFKVQKADGTKQSVTVKVDRLRVYSDYYLAN